EVRARDHKMVERHVNRRDGLSLVMRDPPSRLINDGWAARFRASFDQTRQMRSSARAATAI
ncbi:MAG TPA: hypothetical protein VFR21_10085, partial [Bradyrhizobium sp.]|nr:hypothetical protein [Bradyrhizobium sp.]